MKICVIGTGYVGLVTGACLADFGNSVVCMDKDNKRVKMLQKGKVPFHEPGLPELVLSNIKAKRLCFTRDLGAAIMDSEVIFITVGTPPKPNGEADISSVIEVAKKIAKSIKGERNIPSSSELSFKIIVNKSTVPVGMGDIVTKTLLEHGVPEEAFSVVSNPEFLREGSAISDFFKPDRIVIGASNNRAFNVITELYRPLNAHIIFTDIKSAELIKYASNSFLATKISFINEMANICERVGSDVNEVAAAMGLDKRIGRQFLNAGLGYGGSCLPKDVAALTHLARIKGYDPKLLSSVSAINEYQASSFVKKVLKKLGKVRNKKIAVLGLAFKPGTDDLRESSAVKVVNALLKKGAKVRVYDPVSEKGARKLVPGAVFCPSVYEAAEKVEAIIVATEWPEFRELDLAKMRKLVRQPLIFDGRNIYHPQKVRDEGFEYVGVGR